MGSFDISNLVMAFMAGAAGAGFGGFYFFVLCAGIALVGAVTGINTSGFAFGPLLTPATNFIGSVFAAAYANYKGYEGGGFAGGSTLMSLRKPGLIILGGIGGLLGWVLNGLIAMIGMPGLDTVACAVVIIPLVWKCILQKTPTGVVPEEDKAVGGRFSPIGGRGWFGGMRRGIDKLLWPAAYGAVMVTGYVALMQGGMTACANLLGFGFGGFVLLFPTVPAQHFIGCVAITAFTLSGIDPLTNANAYLFAAIYGIAFGTLSAQFADFGADVFYRYGYVHIDIPAQSIAYCTIITGILSWAGVMTMGGGLVVPIVIEVLCIIWSVAYDSKWKKFAAAKGLTY